MGRVEGRVAVVTGGGADLGRTGEPVDAAGAELLIESGVLQARSSEAERRHR